jgi:chromosome segregation and condensation protein ScpB
LPSLRSRLEALLFVASEPATLKELCAATDAAPEAIKSALADLAVFLRDRGMTLREVAYLQPVTRPEVEGLRGVISDGVMNTLEQRDLIRELGRKEVVGRPILYGTTEFFLESFDLKSIDDLPALPEGAPKRVDGRVIQLPLPEGREQAMAQIHDAVEGHEDDVAAMGDAKLSDDVAHELERALSDSD